MAGSILNVQGRRNSSPQAQGRTLLVGLSGAGDHHAEETFRVHDFPCQFHRPLSDCSRSAVACTDAASDTLLRQGRGLDLDHRVRASLDASAREREMTSLKPAHEGVRAVLSRSHEERPRLDVRVDAIEPKTGIRALDDCPAEALRVSELECAALEPAGGPTASVTATITTTQPIPMTTRLTNRPSRGGIGGAYPMKNSSSSGFHILRPSGRHRASRAVRAYLADAAVDERERVLPPRAHQTSALSR